MRRGNIGEKYSWYISGTAHHSDTKVKQDLKSSLWCGVRGRGWEGQGDGWSLFDYMKLSRMECRSFK